MKLHYCCTLHLAAQSIWEKGGQQWDIWRLAQETSGAANVSILELCAGVGAEYSSVHSVHPNCKLQPVHKLLHVVLPLTTSAMPDGYQYTLVKCVNSKAPISVSSLLQRWICYAENVSSFLSHSQWPSTRAVQYDGKRKWRCNRTCQQSPAPQKAFKINFQAPVSFEEAGIPFEDNGGYLFALDSKVIVDAAAMTAVSTVITSGIQRYNNFVEKRLERSTKPIKKPLRKNKLRGIKIFPDNPPQWLLVVFAVLHCMPDKERGTAATTVIEQTGWYADR